MVFLATIVLYSTTRKSVKIIVEGIVTRNKYIILKPYNIK